MKFKPYPSYKDSGVEWLGEIPEHWKVVSLRYLISTIKGYAFKTYDYCDSGISMVRASDIKRQSVLVSSIFLPNEFSIIYKKVLLNKGDIILSTVGSSPEAINSAVGQIGRIPEYLDGALLNQNTVKFKPNNKLQQEYLLYILSINSYREHLNIYAHGTANQASLNIEDMITYKVILPSIQEQTIIANFLDRETSHIDELRKEKENFIELLKEKRQALISHAVTKGLNPTVKMKNSGVDWLGEIPAHWQIKRIKHIFQIRKRIAGKEGYSVLSITQTGIKIKDIISGEGQLAMDYSKYQFVEIGDFAMNHMDLLTGFVDISKYHGVTSPDYRVFALTDVNSVAGYYLYLMQMGYSNKIFYAQGQGVANIGRWRFQTEPFNNFAIPYPPKEEQQAIANFIDREINKIAALITETQNSINLLKEHRAALISAAVTGKIDIRELYRSNAPALER